MFIASQAREGHMPIGSSLAADSRNPLDRREHVGQTGRVSMNDSAIADKQRQEATVEFKNRKGDRQKAAQILRPLLKQGMSRQAVKELLGAPSFETDNGSGWAYVLFYESVLAVHFDAAGNLMEVN
jgi:hypothetical protein